MRPVGRLSSGVMPEIDPPLITLVVPGKWSNAAFLAARLEQTPGGYALGGDVVRNAATGRTYAAEVLPRADGMKHAFELAGQGRMRRSDVLAVGNHTLSLRVSGFGGSGGAAVEMMRLGASLLGAGGSGVLVETSGIAHNKEDFLKLAGDRDTGGRYWAFVTLVGQQRASTPVAGGEPVPAGTYYSCGMQALGFRDVITDVLTDPQQAWSVCHQFNGYVHQSGVPMNDGDPIGNEHGALYRVKAEDCLHYPSGHPYHNPYGMWRIVKTGELPGKN